MLGAGDVLRLADRFYEAAEDGQAMGEALAALAEAAGGRHAVAAERHAGDGRWSAALGNIDPELGQRLPSTLQSDAVRLWLERIPERNWDRMCALVPGSTPLSRALYDTAFYGEFVQPMGGHHAALTAMSLGGSRSFLSIFRPERLGDYDPQAMQLLEILRPHMERAFRIGQRLGEAAGTAHAAFGMLDRLQTGVVLLDRKLRLQFANRAALEMARDCEELIVDALGPRLRGATLARRLQAMLAEAAGRAPPMGVQRLVVPREASAYPLVLHVERLQTPGFRASNVSVGLFIDDPGAALAVDHAVLADAFGLTPREAALTAALAGGASLRSAAHDLAISEATAKTHLKRVLDKAGAHRQAELVSLAAGLARR
ncbi:MAG: hypothetical protein JF588_13840 [Caulobacterales bacterium]|nr:hypothetical protein [Caulobacterales bacterium]